MSPTPGISTDFDERLRAALLDLGPNPGRPEAMKFCPAHPNTETPSLSTNLHRDEEKPLFNCKGEGLCTQEAVMEALLGRRESPGTGSTRRDWTGGSRGSWRGRRKREPYKPRDGCVEYDLGAYLHVRTPEKTMPWVEKKKMLYGLPEGVDIETVPLYNSDDIPSFDHDKPIYLSEGEKAADACRAAGLQAVGTVTGASACPSPAVLECLRGFKVVLVPDNDEAGAAHMAEVGSRLLSVSPEVIIYRHADDAQDGADMADILWPELDAPTLHKMAEGQSELTLLVMEALEAVKDRLRPFTPLPESDDNLFTDTAGLYANAPDATWAIPYICFYGGLGLLAAVPKAGKTQLVLVAIAAGVQGRPFLGRDVIFDRVIYMSEQGKVTLKDQLSRAGLGVNVESIDWLRKMNVLHLDWVQRVEVVEKRIRTRYPGQRVLVVVDTLAEWIATGPGEENDSGAMRKGMEPLQRIAQETGAAVLAILHAKFITAEPSPSDDDVDLSPVRMVRGSTQMAGSADIISGLAKPPHRQGSGRRIRQIASEGRLDGLLDEGANIEWAEDNTYVLLEPGEDLEVNRAKRLIVATLAKANGQSREELAQSTGITEATVRRALDDLTSMADMVLSMTGKGVRGDPYIYWLPAKDPDPGHDETGTKARPETLPGGRSRVDPGPLTGDHSGPSPRVAQAWKDSVPLENVEGPLTGDQAFPVKGSESTGETATASRPPCAKEEELFRAHIASWERVPGTADEWLCRACDEPEPDNDTPAEHGPWLTM